MGRHQRSRRSGAPTGAGTVYEGTPAPRGSPKWNAVIAAVAKCPKIAHYAPLMLDEESKTLGMASGVCPLCGDGLQGSPPLRIVQCRSGPHVLALHIACASKYHSTFTAKNKRVFATCLCYPCLGKLPDSGSQLSAVPPELSAAWDSILGRKPATAAPKMEHKSSVGSASGAGYGEGGEGDDDGAEAEAGELEEEEEEEVVPVCQNILTSGELCGRDLPEDSEFCRRCLRMMNKKVAPLKSRAKPLPERVVPVVVSEPSTPTGPTASSSPASKATADSSNLDDFKLSNDPDPVPTADVSMLSSGLPTPSQLFGPPGMGGPLGIAAPTGSTLPGLGSLLGIDGANGSGAGSGGGGGAGSGGGGGGSSRLSMWSTGADTSAADDARKKAEQDAARRQAAAVQAERQRQETEARHRLQAEADRQRKVTEAERARLANDEERLRHATETERQRLHTMAAELARALHAKELELKRGLAAMDARLRAVEARERAVIGRERAVGARELIANQREKAVAIREEELTKRELLVAAKEPQVQPQPAAAPVATTAGAAAAQAVPQPTPSN